MPQNKFFSQNQLQFLFTFLLKKEKYENAIPVQEKRMQSEKSENGLFPKKGQHETRNEWSHIHDISFTRISRYTLTEQKIENYGENRIYCRKIMEKRWN